MLVRDKSVVRRLRAQRVPGNSCGRDRRRAVNRGSRREIKREASKATNRRWKREATTRAELKTIKEGESKLAGGRQPKAFILSTWDTGGNFRI